MKIKGNLHLVIALFLLAIPFLFWNQGKYRAGGDDSLLYYLYPQEMISNYLNNLVSRNNPGVLASYGTQLFQVPFVFIILLLKKIFWFLNTQSLMFGLNLSLGYYFFILFCREFFNREKHIGQEVVYGLFYTFSAFTVYTLWSHQLLALYLVLLLPLTLFLFIKALKTNNYQITIFLGLLISIFSIMVAAVPWVLATLICIFPLLIFLLIKHRAIFYKHLLLLSVLLILLNFYWGYHVVNALFFHKSGTNIFAETLSQSKEYEAEFTIKSVAGDNNILAPLFGHFHILIQKNNSWPYYSIYEKWGRFFLPLFVVIPLIFFLSLFINKKRNYESYIPFFVWSFALYFFTVNIIGRLGIDIFINLNKYIPGFNMLKNMFDKFGYVMAFSSAFLLASGIEVLDNIKNRKNYNLTIFILFILITLDAKPFILGEYFNFPLGGTKNTENKISGLDNDFMETTNYLSTLPDDSKIMWLPLNDANYVPIKDSADMTGTRYYYGVSPIEFLSNKSDIAGFMGAGNFAKPLRKAVIARDEKTFGDIINKLNIGYFIINNNLSDELKKSSMLPENLYSLQIDDSFLKLILGEKVANFGSKFVVYKVSDKYISERFEIITNNSAEKIIIKTKKFSDYEYDIEYPDDGKDKTFYFNDIYSNFWQLKSNNIILNRNNDYLWFNNSWQVPANLCELNNCQKNGKYIKLKLYMLPSQFDKMAKIISVASWIVLVLVVSINLIQKND